MRGRDWTTLPTDLVLLIGGLLIADDVTDFVRLRTVCRPWRSSTMETKNHADCFCPRNWIMLSDPDSAPAAVCFFNTTTHKTFSFDLSRYLDTYTLFRSFDYLFLLTHKITQGFALLNPFMRSITPLSSKIESNSEKAPSLLEDLIREQNFDISGVFVTSSSTIALVFTSMDYLVWTKPGYQSCVYAEYKECKVQCYSNVLFYKDRLLTIDCYKGLVQINLANEMPSQSQVEIVIPSNKLPDVDNDCYIVDCGGEIVLVTSLPDDVYQEHLWESFEMYKLDLNEKTYVCSPNLDDRSIFLGQNRTFSISSEDSSLVQANSVYLCELYYGESACYNLRTNSVRYQSCKPFLHPSSLVEKLIKYCLRLNWEISSEDED